MVSAGMPLFNAHCETCHGANGGGTNEGGLAPPYSELPRAQSVGGVMEQLIEPINEFAVKMPNFDARFTFAEKEDLGAYVCVDLTKKCEEAH